MPKKVTHSAADEGGALFLPGIERAIASALQGVAEHEHGLDSISSVDSAEAVSKQLDSSRDRIFGLKTCADRPAQMVADMDAVLQSSEDEIRAYLEGVETLRQNLAAWAALNL